MTSVVTAAEADQFRQAAARAGLDLGEWLRRAARRAAGLPDDSQP